ncbi:MAG: shikimate kinase AroK, partial [Porticoccus sp.]|nr:shikimate kinase AroK [Porticoccus sp.]
MGIFSFLDKQPKCLLGLDISSSAVKLLEISRNGNRYRVESYLVRPLPPNTVVEKNINDVDALADTVRKVVSQSKAKAKDTAVAVSGSSVITKVIEMPDTKNYQRRTSGLMSKQNNLFLVGPMGAGKTTIGRFLADYLSLEFIDLDAEIETRCGANIPWIFDVEGEAGFRKRESQILEEVTTRSGILLATGGGAVLDESNREILKQRGYVAYLSASVEQLLERTANDRSRPLLQVDNPREVIEKLIAERDPLYREVADLVVVT